MIFNRIVEQNCTSDELGSSQSKLSPVLGTPKPVLRVEVKRGNAVIRFF